MSGHVIWLLQYDLMSKCSWKRKMVAQRTTNIRCPKFTKWGLVREFDFQCSSRFFLCLWQKLQKCLIVNSISTTETFNSHTFSRLSNIIKTCNFLQDQDLIIELKYTYINQEGVLAMNFLKVYIYTNQKTMVYSIFAKITNIKNKS